MTKKIKGKKIDDKKIKGKKIDDKRGTMIDKILHRKLKYNQKL
jgi:hypothetical protein